MSPAPLKPSAAVGQLLRRRRHELGWTLREVAERTGGHGRRIPASTLARIEQGKLDPGVPRLHQLIKLYRLPNHLVADMLELESLAVAEPDTKDLDALFKDGVAAWNGGDVGTGLAYLIAVRRFVPEDEASRLLRQKATLAFGVSAMSLGKIAIARRIADELFLEGPHAEVKVNLLVLASSAWQRAGSQVLASAFIHEAERALEPGDDRRAAWVHHGKASVLARGGEPAAAMKAFDAALDLYRRLGDAAGEIKVLLARTDALLGLGRPEDALASAEAACALAQREGHRSSLGRAKVECGRLLLRLGRFEEVVRVVREGLAEAVAVGERHTEFHGRYYLWKAFADLGRPEEAATELAAARTLVHYTDDAEPESREVRALASTSPR